MTTNTVTTTTTVDTWACLGCGATYGIGGPEVVCGTIAGGEICGGTLHPVVDVTVTEVPTPEQAADAAYADMLAKTHSVRTALVARRRARAAAERAARA